MAQVHDSLASYGDVLTGFVKILRLLAKSARLPVGPRHARFLLGPVRATPGAI
jgi:hypothetical protein